MPRKSSRPPWLSWSLKEGRLSRAGGLPKEAVSRLREKASLSPRETKTLLDAYTKTQYAKLRRAGVGRDEAWKLSRSRDPREVTRVARDRRAYIEEMTMRKGPKSGRAFVRTRRAIAKAVRKKKYKDSDWARFAQWYGKTAAQKQAEYPQWPKLAPQVGKTAEQFPFEHQAQMLPEPTEYVWRPAESPITGEPMPEALRPPPKLRRRTKAVRLKEQLQRAKKREEKLREEIKIMKARKSRTYFRDRRGRFTTRRKARR